MSNLKWRQQRTVGGIPLDSNLQAANFAASSANAAIHSRRGLFLGPERRNRCRRGGILLLFALSLFGYSMYRNSKLQYITLDVNKSMHATPIVLDTPLLLFTCQRGEYLNRTLAAVFKYHPLHPQSPTKQQTSAVIAGAPIVISQDGNDPSVQAVIQYYAKLFQSIHVPYYHIIHETNLALNPYQALSQHYAWALEKVFSGKAYITQDWKPIGMTLEPQPKRVIILEEDLDIAVDFFSYMSATAPLLDSDTSLLAVSAYNDNGKKNLVGDPRRLVRSDFFPGLGWMMHSSLWKQVQPWPNAYWDDWLREPKQRKGRHVIRPEISRTFHFGSQGGASSNQYSHHLDTILLNKKIIDWSQQDLTYLNKDIFTQKYKQDVASAKLAYLDPDEWHETKIRNQILDMLRQNSVKMKYKDWDDFVILAKMWDLMDNEKAGVPRTAFLGIVECRPLGKGGNILYLIPASYRS